MICLWKTYHPVWVLKGQCGCIQKTASLVLQKATVTLNMTLPNYVTFGDPFLRVRRSYQCFPIREEQGHDQLCLGVWDVEWTQCGIGKIRSDAGSAAQGRDGDSLRDKTMKEILGSRWEWEMRGGKRTELGAELDMWEKALISVLNIFFL